MPRELVRLEGHSKPCASIKFVGKDHVLSAGKDGSIRKYDVSSLTMRQKLGTVGQGVKLNKEVQNVAEMAFGWQREAAWNNVFCRQVYGKRLLNMCQKERNSRKIDSILAKISNFVNFSGWKLPFFSIYTFIAFFYRLSHIFGLLGYTQRWSRVKNQP